MNNIEQRIWEYIDGSAGEGQKKATEELIASDPAYMAIYEELKLINNDLSNLEMEEPSMSFNRNVMDRIALEPVPGSVRSLIDKKIIYGIAAFFLITIVGLLVFLFANIDWSLTSGLQYSAITFPKYNYSTFANSNVIRGFLFIDLVLALLFMDSFLRKRVNSKKL